MRPGSCRPLQIADLMILVVATAGALFLVNQLRAGDNGLPPGALGVALWIQTWITPWLSMMTLAFFVMRLRRPRPPFRLMFRQPGAIAAVLALSNLGYIGMLTLGRLAVRGTRGSATFSFPTPLAQVLGDFFLFMSIQAGPMIAGAWIALRLTGRLRRERGWLDGLGTIVGATWILIAIVQIFYFVVFD
jgi:hypothetical protein